MTNKNSRNQNFQLASIFAFIGGILTILISLLFIVLFLMSGNEEIQMSGGGTLQTYLIGYLPFVIWFLICGIFLLIGGFLIKKEKKRKIGAIITLLAGILGLNIFSFIGMIGGIIAIANLK